MIDIGMGDWIKDYNGYLLMKFTSKYRYQQRFLDGKLFFNTSDFFARCDDAGRSDHHDIDLILIYSIANYDAMKRLKDVLAEAIYDTFNIPVHYTTLSENEYEEMYALRQEKQCVLFEYYHK